MLSACPGANQGVLLAGLENTRFVADEQTLVVVTQRHASLEQTHEIRTLRGDYVRTIATGSFNLVDVDDAGERFIGQAYLETEVPGFFAGTVSGSMRLLPESDSWFAAAIDSNGTRIAVTDPERQIIKVFSFADLESAREIPCPETAFCYWISWDIADADVLWVAGRGPGNNYTRIDLRSDASSNFAPDAFPNVRRANMVPGSLHSERCWASDVVLERSNDGIAVRSGDDVRRLVTIQGFSSRRSPAIGWASFIADCRYVLFSYAAGSWVADVQSGLVGRLEGEAAFVLR